MGNVSAYSLMRDAYASLARCPRGLLAFVVVIAVLGIANHQLQRWEVQQGPQTPPFSALGTLTLVYLEIASLLMWHRTVLLHQRTTEWLLRPSWQLGKFAFWYIAYIGVITVPAQFLCNEARRAASGTAWEMLADWPLFVALSTLALVVMAGLLACFGFIFPAIALSSHSSLRGSMRKAVGRTGLLFSQLLLVEASLVLVMGAPYLVAQASTGAVRLLALEASSVASQFGALVMASAVCLAYLRVGSPNQEERVSLIS